MVIRDTAGLIIPIGMPLLILITSASAPTGETVRDGFTAFDLFVLPIVFVMVIALVGVINMRASSPTTARRGSCAGTARRRRLPCSCSSRRRS